jgi:CDGSH-type Zn-finger protein
MSEAGGAAVRVRVDPHGPTYVDGPVELSVDGGETVVVDRFRVAICACRRSDRYPLCDGSHQALERGSDEEES